ncbi:MAG: protein translocase subunit SecF, partial [Rhodothermales bacterium]|nr:protein translocase subunit SecF [Rhodothermales bacterium]
MRLFEKLNAAFIPNRRKAYIVSGIVILLCVASLAIRGLETGIDFQGGMEFVIETDGDLDVSTVRGGLASALSTT